MNKYTSTLFWVEKKKNGLHNASSTSSSLGSPKSSSVVLYNSNRITVNHKSVTMNTNLIHSRISRWAVNDPEWYQAYHPRFWVAPIFFFNVLENISHIFVPGGSSL